MDKRQASSHNEVPGILAGEKKCRWSKAKNNRRSFLRAAVGRPKAVPADFSPCCEKIR